MPKIAKIVTEVSLNQEFDYRIPEALRNKLKIGSQVNIPFNNRNIKGFVVGFSQFSKFENSLKSITDIVGDKPLIPHSVVNLAYWISDYYCSPIENSIKALLPSVVRKKSNHYKKQFSATLLKDTNEDITLLQKKIIDFLKRNG